MPLTLYRRHTTKCTGHFQQYDREARNCRCMIQVEGQLGNDYIRKSTGTRTWQHAEIIARKAERAGAWKTVKVSSNKDDGKRVSDAVEAYLVECESETGRHLSIATLSKYKTVLRGLTKFCQERGIQTMDQIDFITLQGYRKTWTTASHATCNNISCLKAFWKYAVKHGLAKVNVADDLEIPRGVAPVERLPFTEEQMDDILKTAREMAIGKLVTNFELETFVMVQRYAGLALADAALLQTSELRGDEIRYYRKKLMRSPSRRLARVPIPADLVERLKKIPIKMGKYYFCVGSDVLSVAVEAWRWRLRKLFDAAGIADGTSHRFRHTFAYDLLTSGVPMEKVSRWLGHASIAMTEKHYNHFLEGRIQADNDILRALYAKRSSAS